jgi:hypothetical protein
MNLEQLEKTLSRYGGNPARWPADERAAAEALIASDAAAAKLQSEAARLDALIGEAVQPVAMDSATVGRIMAGVGNGRHHEVAVRPTPRLFAWAGAAMVAFLVVGYAVGLAIPTNQGEDALAGLMFGSSSATVSDSGSVL